MQNLNAHVIIKKPLISEKSLYLYKMFKICTFWVDPKATKKQIEYEFEQLFGIKPRAIRTSLLKKRKKYREAKTYLTKVKRSFLKKAYIDIGDNKLNVFEDVVK